MWIIHNIFFNTDQAQHKIANKVRSANNAWGCFFNTKGETMVRWINKSGEYAVAQVQATMFS